MPPCSYDATLFLWCYPGPLGLVPMLYACFNALCLFQCSVLVYLLGESMTCVRAGMSRASMSCVQPPRSRDDDMEFSPATGPLPHRAQG